MSNQYPEYIMKILREMNDLDPDNHLHDGALQSMDRREVFAKVLEWEGIIGFEYAILGWIRDIFKVDVTDKDSFL